MIESFNQFFLEKISLNVRRKVRFVKTEVLPPWLDIEVSRQMKIRDSLKHSQNWDDYKKQRNLVTNLINKKKKTYFSRLVKNSANNNTKPIWDALNIGKTKKKSSSSSSTLTSKDLNNHFSTIADILGHGFRKENHSKNTPEIRDNTTDKLSGKILV